MTLQFFIALTLCSSEPAAEPSEPEDRRVWIGVTAEVGEQTDGMFARRIREAAAEGLDAEGWSIATAASRRLQIEVTVADAETYGLSYSLVRAGMLPEPLHHSECRRCGSDQVLALVHADIATVLERLPEPQSVATVAPAAVAQPEVDTLAPGFGLESRALGRLGRGGLAALVVGSAGIVAGATLVALGERQPVDELHARRSEYTVAGAVALGLGIGSAVTGVVLLAVDRKRIRASRTRVDAWLPSRGVGMSMVVRW